MILPFIHDRFMPDLELSIRRLADMGAFLTQEEMGDSGYRHIARCLGGRDRSIKRLTACIESGAKYSSSFELETLLYSFSYFSGVLPRAGEEPRDYLTSITGSDLILSQLEYERLVDQTFGGDMALYEELEGAWIDEDAAFRLENEELWQQLGFLIRLKDRGLNYILSRNTFEQYIARRELKIPNYENVNAARYLLWFMATPDINDEIPTIFAPEHIDDFAREGIIPPVALTAWAYVLTAVSRGQDWQQPDLPEGYPDYDNIRGPIYYVAVYIEWVQNFYWTLSNAINNSTDIADERDARERQLLALRQRLRLAYEAGIPDREIQFLRRMRR